MFVGIIASTHSCQKMKASQETLLIDGIVQEGSTLTANTDSIKDDDGSLTFTFQWQLADDVLDFDSNSNISGAM